MDLALAIESLIPSAAYSGSVTENTEAAFDSIIWQDERDQPTWEELVQCWEELEEEISWNVVRQERSRLFTKHGWRIERYLTQAAIQETPTESEQKYEELCSYFQQLRDITETYENPAEVTWPPEP